MLNDLSAQIRALVDSVEPVSASEAIARRGAVELADAPPGHVGVPDTSCSSASPESRESIDSSAGVRGNPRRGRRVVAVAASAAVLLGTGLGLALGPSGPRSVGNRSGRRPGHGSAVLTGAEVHAIVAHSTTASGSGIAIVTQVSAEDGAPQTNTSVKVTFDGENIDELITVRPQPPGSAATFTTDDRLVDGQFYIYTPGPSGITEWLHDTNSANDLASMQFPDPRTLYSALSPNAQFEVIGTTTSSGTKLTKLEALDPSVMDTNSLGSFAGGTLTSFVMTLGPENVVEQMSFTSTQTQRVCKFTGTSQQLKAALERNGVSITPGGTIDFSELEKKGVIAIARSDDGKVVRVIAQPAAGGLATCGSATWSNTVGITFSNLGDPETIAVPNGAINYQGKG